MRTYIVDKKYIAAIALVLSPGSEKGKIISGKTIDLIEEVCRLVPDCRERSAAITQIESGVLLALAGIAHEVTEKHSTPVKPSGEPSEIDDLEATLRTARKFPAAFDASWIAGLEDKIAQLKASKK